MEAAAAGPSSLEEEVERQRSGFRVLFAYTVNSSLLLVNTSDENMEEGKYKRCFGFMKRK